MAEVIFSSELQRFTGEERVSIKAANYRDLVAALLSRYQELPEQALTEMAVAIDGEIIHDPFLETVGANSEVHFLFKISGG